MLHFFLYQGHTIKPRTPEHGTAAEQWNTGGTLEHCWNKGTLAEQSEYHGIADRRTSAEPNTGRQHIEQIT